MVDDKLALDGITVLDLGQVYNGPYCSLLLAHLGAHVIKVEPIDGEHTRRRSPQPEPYPLILLNSNKDGLGLNLKSGQGRRLFLDLVATADIVVENFAEGVLERLGCGWDELQSANPRVILASGRGFNDHGGWGGVPAMDLAVQALGGVLAVTGFADGPPVKCGGAVADILGGTTLAVAALAALHERERTGRGQHVSVPMLDATLPTLTSPLAGYLETGGTLPERTGNRHGGLEVAPYNVYRCKDGWMTVFCAREQHWRALATTLGHPELVEADGFSSMRSRAQNMDEVDDLVTAWTTQRSRAEASAALLAQGVPCAPVRGIGELLDDAGLRDSGALPEVEHATRGRVRAFGSPFHVRGRKPRPLVPAPTLGQHSRDVLHSRLDLSGDDIDRLLTEGVIA